jgi:hypothetical protein
MEVCVPLVDIQNWLDSLPGAYVIQKMTNGQILFALTMGSVSVSVLRPTFVEAAAAAVEHSRHIATKKTRVA